MVAVWRIPKLLEINTISILLLFWVKYIIEGVLYLTIDTYNYIVIAIHKQSCSFITYLLQVIPFYYLNCFLMSSEICKKFRE